MLKKIAITFAVFSAGCWIAWELNPWPSALLFRALMDKGGWAMNDALAKHVPKGITEQRDIAYEPTDPSLRLDIYVPKVKEGEGLPLVVWIHGGGFLSGSKDQIANYLRIIAAKGYAVAGIDYTIAPGAKYPGPVRQASAAIKFLTREAAKFRFDASRVVLAGDSAGAQIAAQTALVISSPEYAARTGIAAPIERKALRGAILHCGSHDPESLNFESAFVKATTWAYFGVKTLAGDARVKDFSIVANVVPELPPLFISAGNADPLGPQSKKLAEVAAAKGVAVDSLFFPDAYEPPLQHEYQFDLDREAGETALARTDAFLARVMK